MRSEQFGTVRLSLRRPPARCARPARRETPPRSSVLGLLCLGLLAMLVGPTRQAAAWGRMAHRASTRLAETRLSPRARAVIHDLLEPGESLADASTWADENSQSIPGSAAWHYVNVPLSAARYSPRNCHENCVVSRFEEFRRVLADPRSPVPRRRMALRYVVHLLEDAHQPLHVGDHRDRGGNNLQLQFYGDAFTNLHQVWDSGLLRNGFRNERELTFELIELAKEPESEAWARGRIEDWVDESLEAARKAYRVPGSSEFLRAGMRIGRDYEEANLKLAVQRLAQAGIRLSEVLNDCLDPSLRSAIPAPHFPKQRQPQYLPTPPAARVQ